MVESGSCQFETISWYSLCAKTINILKQYNGWSTRRWTWRFSQYCLFNRRNSILTFCSLARAFHVLGFQHIQCPLSSTDTPTDELAFLYPPQLSNRVAPRHLDTSSESYSVYIKPDSSQFPYLGFPKNTIRRLCKRDGELGFDGNGHLERCNYVHDMSL